MPPPSSPREPQRIAKLLARAGIASRRDIERMIEEGRIAINGETVEKPATLLTSLHGVTVDGQPVKAPAPARLFRYHKPPGVLTAARDPKGRPTIYDRLPTGLPRLMPVGRLDMNTEGLLLLTTDGELKRQLELPSSGVERTYRARAFGDVSQEQLEELIHGIEIDGVRYGQIDANLERRTGRNQWIEMRLTEGKNREVRRVLEHLGLQVSRLIRTAYGPFPLADLPAGAVDEVRQHDLVEFRQSLDPARSRRRDEAGPDEARPSRPPRPRLPRGDQASRDGAAPKARPSRPPRAGQAQSRDGSDPKARPGRPPRAGQAQSRDGSDPKGRPGRPPRSGQAQSRDGSDPKARPSRRPRGGNAPTHDGTAPRGRAGARRPGRPAPSGPGRK